VEKKKLFLLNVTEELLHVAQYKTWKREVGLTILFS
jgi:hypothetical protein